MGFRVRRRRGTVAKVAGATGVACALAGCALGYGVYGIALAGSVDDAMTFGVGNATIDLSVSWGADESGAEAADDDASSALETTTARDITQSVSDIAERQEAERRAAEEAARIDEQNHIAAAQAAIASQQESVGIPSALSEVDWLVGKDAFISEWTARIDAYLAGSSLDGYGAIFAEAAWEYGIDPRFSPAISNTESSKGANCFRSYNAWGWMGEESWSSWEESIWAHAAGLAEGYGYTISEWGAAKYCPPTWQDWYQKTLYQMTLI